jgi:hypothetical protein
MHKTTYLVVSLIAVRRHGVNIKNMWCNIHWKFRRTEERSIKVNKTGNHGTKWKHKQTRKANAVLGYRQRLESKWNNDDHLWERQRSRNRVDYSTSAQRTGVPYHLHGAVWSGRGAPQTYRKLKQVRSFTCPSPRRLSARHPSSITTP